MKSALAYNPNVFSTVNLPNLPDFDRWRSIYKLFNFAVSFVDRTEIIKTPIRTSTPYILKMPSYEINFSKTYDECCIESAISLIQIQDKLNVPIRIMYSGGIDSSLILTSLIKVIGVEESAKRVEVFMDQESISENKGLWENFIRPHFTIIDSDRYGSFLKTDGIMVAGEGNDQLLGSDIYKDVVRWGGNGVLNQKWTEGNIREYFKNKSITDDESDLLFSLFYKLMSASPCKIETVGDWWWYINFSCKWGSVYHRMMFYVQNPEIITDDYMRNYYYQFFNTDSFQRWSMVNRTEKHQGDYLTYKYHAKNLIIDVTKDETYRDKIKRPSLSNITRFKYACDLIDDSYHFHYNINPMDFYNSDNSFK